MRRSRDVASHCRATVATVICAFGVGSRYPGNCFVISMASRCRDWPVVHQGPYEHVPIIRYIHMYACTCESGLSRCIGRYIREAEARLESLES